MKHAVAAVVSIMMASAFSAVAAPARYGENAPDTVEKIRLAEIIMTPDSYNDRTMLVSGLFYGSDADGDDFYFKDKTDIIEVAPPPDTKVMSEIKPNTEITVYGKVVVRHRNGQTLVHMIASGVSVP
jgi:uncharacterized protein YdeI (BOF family)